MKEHANIEELRLAKEEQFFNKLEESIKISESDQPHCLKEENVLFPNQR